MCGARRPRRPLQALTGNYRAEHLFSLRQAVELYDTYQDKLRDCDQEIEGVLTELNRERELPQAPIPKKRNRQRL
jgi:transposase